MSDVDKPMELRVSDLEDFYTDLPELFNTRFARLDLQLREMSDRLDLLDRQMGMLTRDLRDLRGGVTRQLIGQDERLTAIEQRLGGVEQRLQTFEERFSAQDAKLDEILRRLPRA